MRYRMDDLLVYAVPAAILALVIVVGYVVA
jgi:hypothetical protein